MADLRINGEQLQEAARSLAGVSERLGGLAQTTDALADAVGHDGLKQACISFNRRWALHQQRMRENIDYLVGAIKSTDEAFTELDQQAAGGRDKGSRHLSSPQAPSAPQDNSGATGLGTSPSLESTATTQAQTAAVSGGAAPAPLEGTAVAPLPATQQVSERGASVALDPATFLATAGVATVSGGGTQSDLEAALAPGTPAPFIVDGVQQESLGYIEGVGTLLGTPNPPTITAILDEHGTVVDINDLQIVTDPRGQVTAINQVDVSHVGAAAGTVEQASHADQASTPGEVSDSAHGAGTSALEHGSATDTKNTPAVTDPAVATILEKPEIQAQMAQVKALLGEGADVFLSGTDEEGLPTLTVAGITGIGLATLVALGAVMKHRDGDITDLGELGGADLDSASLPEDTATADIASGSLAHHDLVAQLARLAEQRQASEAATGAAGFIAAGAVVREAQLGNKEAQS